MRTGFSCGKFVTRIPSTLRILDRNEWDGMQKPNKSVVAATLEKALIYKSAEPLVWDREVGGSNPLAPTNNS